MRNAFFQDNNSLVNWVNQQPLAVPLTCLGDGHDGIWNIYAEIGVDEQPMVEDRVIAEHLTALLTPTIKSQSRFFRELWLRERILTLP